MGVGTLAVLCLAACGANVGDAGSNESAAIQQVAQSEKARLEPTLASLQTFLAKSEGQMLPLYVGKERALISILVEGGVLYHCTAKNNEVVDKETCKQDPFYGMSTNLAGIDGGDAPCYGGVTQNPIGEQYVVGICIAPRRSDDNGPIIDMGQVTYAIGNSSGSQIFTLEPS